MLGIMAALTHCGACIIRKIWLFIQNGTTFNLVVACFEYLFTKTQTDFDDYLVLLILDRRQSGT